MKNSEFPSFRDNRKSSLENTSGKSFDATRNVPKRYTREEVSASIKELQEKVPIHESNSASNETASSHSSDTDFAQVIRKGASYDWFPIDKDTQLCIEQLDQTLQYWNKHVEKTLQEQNKPEAPGKYQLDYEIQKDELKIYNVDNKPLLSFPLEKDIIEDINRYLIQKQEEHSINAIKCLKEIELSYSIKQLKKTLHDWNRHVDETLQKHNNPEKTDKYQLYYTIQENELEIHKVDNKHLFSLPLEKNYLEHFDGYLQILKEHFSINKTIEKLEVIGLSDSIEQLKDTLQEWNNHVISDEYQLFLKDPYKQKIEIFDGKNRHILSLPLEKDKIEHFNSILQWHDQTSQHENLITKSGIDEKDLDIQASNADVQFHPKHFFSSLQESSQAQYHIDMLAISNEEFKAQLPKRDGSKEDDIVDETAAPSQGSDSNHHSQESQTNKDTREAVNLPSETTASSLKKFFYKYFAGRTDEFKKRAAFDKLYEEAHSKSQEATNDPSRRQGLDRTNNADTDVHSDAKKLRSQEIITRLKGAIEKFNIDIESLEEARKRIQQKLNEECENYKRNILQSIENSEHGLEMQKRENFDQTYKGRRNALEQERLKEIQMRKEFDQQKEEYIQEKLYEFMEPKNTHLEQWHIFRYKNIFSEFKKEIDQLKMAEDYRRYRKESKFGTHEPKGKEQKEEKERWKPERDRRSRPLELAYGRNTLHRRVQKLGQIGYPTQSLMWIHLLRPNKRRR